MVKYTHLKPGEDVPTPSGYYTPGKERRLNYNGREVLYIIRDAVVDSSCCGTADFSSALVPGYIVTLDPGKKGGSAKISDVEPVSSRTARKKIREILQQTENVSQVEFW
jgi:hypothetical protein